MERMRGGRVHIFSLVSQNSLHSKGDNFSWLGKEGKFMRYNFN